MVANYDSCEYKLALPEVTILQDRCEVKITFIGKSPEQMTQLALLSCQLISLKQQTYEILMCPDLIRVDSQARVSASGSFEKPVGFGLVGASLSLSVADLQKKQKTDIFFYRGSDRKWELKGLEITENAEIDRSALREKRRNMRKMLGELR